MATARQSHGDEIANVLTHGAGMAFGFVAICLLFYKGILSNDPWSMASVVIYAVCMTASYVTSTFYHASRKAREKLLLRRWDHSAIYLHIAGTYTPFTLITLRQEAYWGWMLFAIVWFAAGIGIWLSFRKMGKNNIWKTVCYLLMGWVVIIAFRPLIAVFEREGTMDIFYWLIGGGLFYSFGTIFFFLDRHKYMHPLWHLFVLGGTVCHFIAVYLLV